MIYVESQTTDPYYNLALEEYLFEHLDSQKECCFFWQNDNTIVVGKYQNTVEEVNRQYVEKHGIRVVRRLSGGGAVYHDKGNLNYTLIVNQADYEDFNFRVFVTPVINALAKFGVAAQFNGRNDITINDQKISGNSQYSRNGRLLHHGCIMLDSNLLNVAEALNVKPAKFDSKSMKSVRSRVTTINANAPAPIEMAEFKKVLREYIFQNAMPEDYHFSPEALKAVKSLKTKYEAWEWNYGHSPIYTMRREMKFPAGLVTAFLNVESGIIKSVSFFGDFFGSRDLTELEQALTGIPLDENLETVLEKLDVSSYMNGITAGQLSGLLR